jgi:phage gp36-like protein
VCSSDLTQTDLTTRFGEAELIQLTYVAVEDDAGPAIDPIVVAQAIADAEAELDAYLTARYSLPLASVPANLERIACDIARYRLYADRPTELVDVRYRDAIRYLEQVGRGVIALASSPAPDAGDAVMVSDTPVFGRDAEW